MFYIFLAYFLARPPLRDDRAVAVGYYTGEEIKHQRSVRLYPARQHQELHGNEGDH